MTWRESTPRPGALWVRWAPRRVPPVAQPRVAFPTARIVWPAPEVYPALSSQDLEAPSAADVAYCPTGLDGTEGLERRVRSARAAGCAVLIHASPAEPIAAAREAVLVWDLLAPLLAEPTSAEAAIERLLAHRPAPARLWLVVPLLPGLFLGPGDLDRALAAARALDPECVVGVSPELSPADRRKLSELLGEERYEAVFHGAAPSERSFAVAARGLGLVWRAPRPALAGLPPRRARNRELAAALAEAGELWLRLGRGEPEGLALHVAARLADDAALDLAALAREGNLEVVDWLPPLARAIVAELAAEGRSRRLEALVDAWSVPDREEPSA